MEHLPIEDDKVPRVAFDGPLRKTPPLPHLLQHLRKEPGALKEVLPLVTEEHHDAA